MTIKEAIQQLERIRRKQGDDVPVFFDCPACGKSFTPGTVAVVTVHIAAEPEP